MTHYLQTDDGSLFALGELGERDEAVSGHYAVVRGGIDSMTWMVNNAGRSASDQWERFYRAAMEDREAAVESLRALYVERVRLREFLYNSPTCEPNADNHYGWPKDVARWRCFNCNEWCSSSIPCHGCEARVLREELERDDDG